VTFEKILLSFAASQKRMATMRMFIVSAVLALTPVVAQAECAWHTEQAAITCAEGMVYDQEAQACVKIVG